MAAKRKATQRQGLTGLGVILSCVCLALVAVLRPGGSTPKATNLGDVTAGTVVITRAATARPTSATARPTSTTTETPMPPTATATNTATAKPTPIPLATPPWPDGINVECRQYGAVQACAWVSNNSPSRYSNVAVYARLVVGAEVISGASVLTTWHYRSSTPTQDCTTEADGIGHCMRNIGGATQGTAVTVDVNVTYKGKVYYTETWFTPG